MCLTLMFKKVCAVNQVNKQNENGNFEAQNGCRISNFIKAMKMLKIPEVNVQFVSNEQAHHTRIFSKLFGFCFGKRFGFSKLGLPGM